jgi:DNA repair protein RadA/Sms
MDRAPQIRRRADRLQRASSAAEFIDMAKRNQPGTGTRGPATPATSKPQGPHSGSTQGGPPSPVGAPRRAAKRRWVCQDCGAVTSGWFGRCPTCGAWNSIAEEAALPSLEGETRGVVLSAPGQALGVVASTDADGDQFEGARRSTGIAELDRVLGGGVAPGSVVLVGGSPGIGKSTLLLQACAGLSRRGARVLYASGEESVAQVGARARRLHATHEQLSLLADTRIEAILTAAEAADVVVVDSVQTVWTDAQEGLAGNVSQIRAVTAALLGFAKSRSIPVILVGHVTKDGQLAGPRLLEHMVDVVLSFEGDEERATRIVRAIKNRFGSTQELAVFEMTSEGLREITNPSAAFLAERPEHAIGSCVTATLEGSRPLLLEIQALLAPSPGGSPRRTAVGTDPTRLAMLLAVLDRHVGLHVADQDVFVNVAGGLRLVEPAVDLAVLLSVASSFKRRPLPALSVAIGEVGLTGEVRRVPRLDARLAEAQRLGFRLAFVPRLREKAAVAALPDGLEIVQVDSVRQAVDEALS